MSRFVTDCHGLSRACHALSREGPSDGYYPWFLSRFVTDCHALKRFCHAFVTLSNWLFCDKSLIEREFNQIGME